MNPPLRSARDREAILEGLADGTIEILCSDHAPHCDYEKEVEFDYAPFGITGLETELALSLMQLVHAKRLSLPDLIAKFTVNPARLLNLNKGTLSAGADADVTVFDPDANGFLTARRRPANRPTVHFTAGNSKAGPWPRLSLESGSGLNKTNWSRSNDRIQIRTMKKIVIVLLAATALGRVNAAESTWLTDLPKAEAQAKAESKIVLMDFTGSDWCGWCIKFKKEVLDTAEFQDYAAKNVVLVELDYPSKKVQSAELKKANAALKDQYNIHGYPTLVVLDKDGKEIGRQVGYSKGGPQAFIARLEKFKAKG